jgi:hypothetical protein
MLVGQHDARAAELISAWWILPLGSPIRITSAAPSAFL